jgi:hypothetical protein
MLLITETNTEDVRLVTEATEDGKKIVQFNDSLSALKFGASSLQKSLAIAFAPQLTEIADGFTDMLIANKDMIKNGLKKFFEMVNLGLGAIVRFGKMLYNLIDGTVGFENALIRNLIRIPLKRTS